MQLSLDGIRVVLAAPALHIVGAALPPWKFGTLENRGSSICFEGKYGKDVDAAFEFVFEDDGWMRLVYTLGTFALKPPA